MYLLLWVCSYNESANEIYASVGDLAAMSRRSGITRALHQTLDSTNNHRCSQVDTHTISQISFRVAPSGGNCSSVGVNAKPQQDISKKEKINKKYISKSTCTG